MNGGDSYGGYRGQLVATLQSKGIRDLAVLRAISLVPRHLFVPESLRHRAYEDSALPIGGGQTISQPWVQARSLELAALTGKERVLEIGTGSGYQTALLSQLAAQVFSIERLPALAQAARRALELAGARNVSIMIGDGTLGWRPYAPTRRRLPTRPIGSMDATSPVSRFSPRKPSPSARVGYSSPA